MEGQGITASQIKGQTMRGAGMVGSAKMKPQTKRKIFYGVFTVLIFALLGGLGYFVSTAPQQFFILSMGLSLLLGILHLILVDSLKLIDDEIENKFSKTLTFTIILQILALLFYSVSFYFLSHKSLYITVFPWNILLFIVPLWINRTFEYAVKIPAHEYKQWFYPEKTIVADMDNIDTSNIAIITYVFSKKFNDPEITNFQTKAPYDIKLGDLFFFFLQEWNYKYPQNTIEFVDDEKQVFGWLFYIKGKWWSPNRYLDPDKTIKENQIKVNQIINTARVQQSVPE